MRLNRFVVISFNIITANLRVKFCNVIEPVLLITFNYLMMDLAPLKTNSQIVKNKSRQLTERTGFIKEQ